MVSAFILVLSMLLVGVLSATQENLSISGNVSFVVADKSLWLENVTYQEAGGSEQDIAGFTPGYINGNYDIDIGNITNNQHGSFKLNFYIVNVLQDDVESIEWAISSVTIPDTLTGVSYRTSGVVGIGTTTADDLATGSSPTIDGVLSLTIIAPNATSLDLSGIVIALGKYVEDSVIERVDAEGNPDPEGNYLLFGWYPQSVKAADVTVSSTPASNGYYLGSDGEYYEQLVFEYDYESLGMSDFLTTFTNGETPVLNTTYYFKVEPLRWRILTENYNDTGNALIVCDTEIQGMAYQSNYTSSGGYYYATYEDGTILTDKTATVGQGVDSEYRVFANNYEYSEIRYYLNNTFYNTAFSDEEKSYIVTTTVDNSLESTMGEGGQYVCRDTEDNVFLLSLADVNNIAYGFKDSSTASDYHDMIDTSKVFKVTDYSLATGGLGFNETYAKMMAEELGLSGMGFTEEEITAYIQAITGTGAGWLRSPHVDNSGRDAYSVGIGFYGDGIVRDDPFGVVPALQIQLS